MSRSARVRRRPSAKKAYRQPRARRSQGWRLPDPVRAKGRRRRHRQPSRVVRPWGKWVGLGLALLLAMGAVGSLAFFWARDALLPRLVRVVEARPGKLETVVSARAAVLHEEWVLTAPAAGVVHLLVGEGQRVRLGTPVLAVNDIEVKAPGPGLVSLVVDGTERRLVVPAGESPPASQVLALKPEPRRTQEGQMVTAGQPLARLIDNRQTRLCVALPPAEVQALAERTRVVVRFPDWQSEELAMKPVAVSPGDDRTYGTLTMVAQDWPEEIGQVHVVGVELVKERYAGLVIPSGCLVERGGRTGVYLVKKTLAEWVAVEVVGQKEGKTAVSGIPEGSQVITNPRWVRDGTIVR